MKSLRAVAMISVLSFCAGSAAGGSCRDDKVISAVIPQPRQVAFSGEDFLLSDRAKILYCNRGQGDDFAVTSFTAFLKEAYNLYVKTSAVDRAKAPAGMILVGNASKDAFLKEALRSQGFETSAKIGSEGYQLWVRADQIILHGSTPAGQFYGLQTLRQLVYKSEKGIAVKGVTITDYPRYQLRGFQFDAGRCPQSISMMKRIVRICSTFKLNFVLFREGDDELNAIDYETNKLGSLNPRAISIDEMAEFIEYAARRHIKVVPEIESLGHSGAKAYQYPGLVGRRGRTTRYEGIGLRIRKRRLVLEKDATYDLLDSIYSEWVPILSSPYIHLGCDEAGRGTGEHLARLTAILNKLAEKHGKSIRPIVWADAASTPRQLEQQVVRCLWAYGETGGRVIDENNRFLNRQGQNVKALAEPECRQEVIMAGGSDSYHKPLAKAKYENAMPNIYSWCRFGKDKPNFIGIFAVQWSGNQHDLWLPDDLTVAEYGWTPDKPTFDYQNCMARIMAALSRMKDYTDPKSYEIDRSCWDGIWLSEDDQWREDIMGLAIPICGE